MDNEFKFLIDAGLDPNAKDHLKSDLDDALKQIKDLELEIPKSKLSESAKEDLRDALKNIKDTVVNVDHSDLNESAKQDLRTAVSAVANLTANIDNVSLNPQFVARLQGLLRGLNNLSINVSNVNVNNPRLQQQAQQIGRNMGQQITAGLNNALRGNEVAIQRFINGLNNAGVNYQQTDNIIQRIGQLGLTINSLSQNIRQNANGNNVLSVEVVGLDEAQNAIRVVQQYNLVTGELINQSDRVRTSIQQIDGNAEIERALQQRVASYREILTLNERINRLNPETDSEQIHVLERQRAEQMEINRIASDRMIFYANQILSEEELIDLARRRGIALRQASEDVRSSFAVMDEQDINRHNERNQVAIGNIQYKLDTEHYSTQLNAVTTQLSKFGSISGHIFDEAKQSSNELMKAYETLQLTMSNTNATDDDRIFAEQEYQKALVKTQNLLKQLNADNNNKIVYTGESQRVNLIATLNKYLSANTKMSNDSKKAIQAWIDKLASSDDMTVGAIKNINNQFKELDIQLRNTGQLGLSTADKLKVAWEKFGGWSIATGSLMSLYHQLKEIPKEVTKLDTHLVELSKVSDLTAEGLASVTKESYELGDQVAKTGTDVLDSITSFKRAGYSIDDSIGLAEEALKTTNISENLKDSGEAASSLVNIMKGFGNESVDFARKINDSINQVSNTEAVDFDNLVDGATRLSAVADQAGMSFEQMLGTLTGGYEILGNMEKVATGQITIFSRLQAIQLEGEEEVSTVAKLEETFSNATKGAVHIVDETTGQLRNVYDILDDIAEVWDSLDKNTREALAIEAAGIRQKNVFLSIMQNWQGVEDAVKSASNAMGSSDEENQKYIESIEGRMAGLESSFQKFSQVAISSDTIKDVVSFGTTLLDVLTQIVDKMGVLTPLFGAAGIGAFIKNLDRQKVLKFA